MMPSAGRWAAPWLLVLVAPASAQPAPRAAELVWQLHGCTRRDSGAPARPGQLDRLSREATTRLASLRASIGQARSRADVRPAVGADVEVQLARQLDRACSWSSASA